MTKDESTADTPDNKHEGDGDEELDPLYGYTPEERELIIRYAPDPNRRTMHRVLGALSGVVLLLILFAVCFILEHMKTAIAIEQAQSYRGDHTDSLFIRVSCNKTKLQPGKTLAYQLDIINLGKQPIKIPDLGRGGTRLTVYLRSDRNKKRRIGSGSRRPLHARAGYLSISPHQTLTREFKCTLPNIPDRWTLFLALDNEKDSSPGVWHGRVQSNRLYLTIGSPKP